RSNLMPLQELTEAQRSRHSVSRKAVRNQRRLVARVHVPHPIRELRISPCGAVMLPEMLRPGTDTHFRPEGTRSFEYFINSVKESSVAQKHEAELIYQGKKLFPVFRSNDQLGRHCDRPIVSLRR